MTIERYRPTGGEINSCDLRDDEERRSRDQAYTSLERSRNLHPKPNPVCLELDRASSDEERIEILAGLNSDQDVVIPTRYYYLAAMLEEHQGEPLMEENCGCSFRSPDEESPAIIFADSEEHYRGALSILGSGHLPMVTDEVLALAELAAEDGSVCYGILAGRPWRAEETED